MPIRNSKVPSAEVFNVRRRRRLTRGHGQSDEVTAQVSEWAKPEDAERPKEVSASQHQPDDVVSEPSKQEPVSIDPGEARGMTTASDPPISGLRSIDQPTADRQLYPLAKAVPGEIGADNQLRLHVKIPYPAAGASATFDQLVTVQGEKVALRLVLTKALKLYALSVAEGTFRSAPTAYSESSNIVQTTRMFPRTAYLVLNEELNRTGLLSERAMGTVIAHRALAAFIATDSAFT